MRELDIINKDRSEFAVIMNYRKMPVVQFDISKSSDSHVGEAKVTYKWEYNGKVAYEGATMQYFAASNGYPAELAISGDNCCLHKDMTYHDVVVLMDNNAAPCLELGKDFLVIVMDKQRGLIFGAFVMKMKSTLSKFCQTPIYVDDADEKEFCARFEDLFAKYIKIHTR